MHRLHAALQGRVAPEREELLSKTASLRARQQVHVQMGGIAVRNRRRRRYGMMDQEGAPLVCIPGFERRTRRISVPKAQGRPPFTFQPFLPVPLVAIGRKSCRENEV